jgi:hypothetical protein
MGALLTVTHIDGIRERYILEYPHGYTTEEADARSPEAREQLISDLMTRHGTPHSCTCAAETDLLDGYPSIESAIEQISNAAGRGPVDLDDDVRLDLIRSIKDSRCTACSVAILVLPFRQPLVVAPLHDARCPFATVGPAAGLGSEARSPGSAGGASPGKP